MKTHRGTRRCRQALYAAAIGLVTVLLAFSGAFYFLIATHAGLLALCDAARDYFGPELRFGTVHGRLSGSFEIDGLRLSGANGFRLNIDRLHIDWLPVGLLTGHLHFKSVDLGKLSLVLPIPAGKSGQWQGSVPKIPLLPVEEIAVDSLNVSGVEIHDQKRPPVRLGPIHFSGSWEGRQLQVKSFTLQLPGIGPLAVKGRLDRGADGIRIRSLQISGPGTVDISGQIGWYTSASRLEIKWHHLYWPLTAHRNPIAFLANGTAHIAGNFFSYSYTATGRLIATGRPVAIAFSGRGNLQQTKIAHIRVDAGALGLVTGRAQIEWGAKREAFAALHISQADLGSLVPALKSDLNGKLTIRLQRPNNKPKVNVALHLVRSTIRGYPLTADLTGLVGPIEGNLIGIDAHILGGNLRGKGLIRWPAPLTGHLNLQIKGIRPELLWATLPGHLNGQLKILLAAHKPSSQMISFDGLLDHSSIRGKPLRLRIAGRASTQTGHRAKIDLSSLVAKLGGTSLAIQGRASRPFDLNGHVKSSDLGVLFPKLGGQLAFSFRLFGSPKNLHLTTIGRAQNLRHGRFRISGLKWTAKVSRLGSSRIRVAVSGVEYSDLGISSGTLDVQGVAQHQRVHLRLNAPRGTVNLQLSGGYNRRHDKWHGKITSLQLLPRHPPAWSLNNEPILEIGRKSVSLGLSCLESSSGRLCLELQQSTRPSALKIGWSIKNVRLAPFEALLGQKEVMTGQLSGHGQLQWVNENVDNAQGSLTLSKARLRFGSAPMLFIGAAHATVTQDRLGNLDGALHLVSPQGAIDARLGLAPGTSFFKRSLTGSVKLNIPHLAFLQSYLNDVQALDGQIHGALSIGGTLEQPKLRGHVSLAAGHARLPDAGITLTSVSFRTAGQGTAPLKITGQAASGGGRLRFWGAVDPTQRPVSIDLHVKGNNFQIMNTLDGRVWVDPDLRILRTLRGVHLNGKIGVPKADLTPRSGMTSRRGITPSPDQVIVGAQQAKPAHPPAVFADLVVHLGKAVRFDGYGLTARIIGEVAVHEIPQQVPTANGRLQLVDGRYTAYGQDLTLKKGVLLFDGGALINPAIDILAIRKPREGIEVGVRVRGRLTQPKLSLTSTPPMRREEQLSWLLFGRPLSENSSTNQSAIVGAALALGLSGGNYLANRIGKTLGIGNLSIGTSSESGSAVAAQPQTISGAAAGAGSATAAGSQAAQLTLGKYLTPRLYVSYGVGLFQAGQAFQLRYKLGRGLELQTESGVSTGGDLIYTFEGGK